MVRETYPFSYAEHELAERRLTTPITVFRASNDEPYRSSSTGPRG